MSSGWFPSISLPGLPKGSSLFIIVGVVIVIVAAVGYVIYRKRTQWDELG
jgi:LPXTG-motif cell wall-anchored protein